MADKQYIADTMLALYKRNGVYPSTAVLAEAAGVTESAAIIALVATGYIRVYGRDVVAEVTAFFARDSNKPTVFSASKALDLPYAHVLAVVIVRGMFGKTSTKPTSRVSIRRAIAADVARKSNKVMSLTEIAAELGCSSKFVNECLRGSDVPYVVRAWGSHAEALAKAIDEANKQPGVFTVAELADKSGMPRPDLRSHFAKRGLLHLLRAQRACKRLVSPKVKKPTVKATAMLKRAPVEAVVVLNPANNSFNQILRKGW